MQHITKLCADHLRAFSENYGVKLKASHAHELVAAFFGYKSRAAMLADTQCPISNLPQASIIVLPPTEPIDQRRKELKDLPPELPDTCSLVEVVYTLLLAEKWLISTPWSTYKQLATSLADNYLIQNTMDKVYRAPVGEGFKEEIVDNSMHLIVTRFYQVLTESMFPGVSVHETNIITNIKLQRFAGHIGYAKHEIYVEM